MYVGVRVGGFVGIEVVGAPVVGLCVGFKVVGWAVDAEGCSVGLRSLGGTVGVSDGLYDGCNVGNLDGEDELGLEVLAVAVVMTNFTVFLLLSFGPVSVLV